MTSFAVALEPAPAPRLAAGALFVHLAAAAAPWIARVPTLPAALLSAAALAGFAWTLARIPGRHARLAGVVIEDDGWRIRLRGAPGWVPAELGSGARAYAALAYLEVRAGERRFGWLLTPRGLPPGAFRRLKARIRLSC